MTLHHGRGRAARSAKAGRFSEEYSDIGVASELSNDAMQERRSGRLSCQRVLRRADCDTQFRHWAVRLQYDFGHPEDYGTSRPVTVTQHDISHAGGPGVGKSPILHVVDSLERGGLEHMVCDLALEQQRRGHPVTVYCLHVLGALAPILQSAGVAVLGGHKRAGLDWRVVREIGAAATRIPGTVVHTHSMMPNYYACAARCWQRFRFRVVCTRHDMGSQIVGDRREWLFRWSVRLTDRVIMVSQGVLEHFVGGRIVSPRKAVVVLNGIRLDRPVRSDPDARAKARTTLGVSAETFVIGCVGRLVPLKDHATAIRALALLGRESPVAARIRLVIIGAGPLSGELRTLALSCGVEQQVVLLGERGDVAELLPGLDVFVMPSLTEGHSIALLEAAAAGLPIVATAVGGNPEIIADGVTGLLVPAGKPEPLAERLRLILSDADLADRLGSGARRWAEENVSVAGMSDAYEAIYAAINAGWRRR